MNNKTEENKLKFNLQALVSRAFVTSVMFTISVCCSSELTRHGFTVVRYNNAIAMAAKFILRENNGIMILPLI
jgi:hypothetical protein